MGAFGVLIGGLGIDDSSAFVREPEGNAVAEWFIKQLKKQLLSKEPGAVQQEEKRRPRAAPHTLWWRQVS